MRETHSLSEYAQTEIKKTGRETDTGTRRSNFVLFQLVVRETRRTPKRGNGMKIEEEVQDSKFG